MLTSQHIECYRWQYSDAIVPYLISQTLGVINLFGNLRKCACQKVREMGTFFDRIDEWRDPQNWAASSLYILFAADTLNKGTLSI